MFRHLKAVYGSAKKNARTKGLPGDCLTVYELYRLYRGSGGRCQVTGVYFDRRKPHGSNRAPFAPSIDRIDNSRGYTADNVRLVCQIANLAMNVWGDAVLRDFIAQAGRPPD